MACCHVAVPTIEPVVPSPDPAAAEPEGTPAAGHFSAFVASLKDSIRDSADLLALEARQAGISAALMLGLAVAIALLSVTTWLLLIAALVAAIANTALGFAGALAIAAILNIIAAVPLVVVIRASSHKLMFPATRRQLRGTPPTSLSDPGKAT